MSDKVTVGDLFAVCLHTPDRMAIGRVIKVSPTSRGNIVEWYSCKKRWVSNGFGLEVNITKLTGKLHEILYDI